MQHIGPLACLAGVELGVRSPGLLLEFECFGAVVPVGDFLGEPLFYRCLGPGDEFELASAYFGQMFRHHVGDGVTLSLLLQFTVDPLTFGAVEDGLNAGFACRHGTVVEIRCVMDVSCGSA